MKTMKFILPGRPITKKNHQRIIKNRRTGRLQVIQSRDYEAYEQACLWALKKYRVHFSGPVKLTARYWMPDRRSWPDLVGLLQATCDILEKAGIIENDRKVVSLDGSGIAGIDRENPRVEVEISEVKAESRMIRIDADRMLEKLGIDNFEIDYTLGGVYLLSKADWLKIAAYLDCEVTPGTCGFYAGGWWWYKVPMED